ncbi:oxidoreductase [Chelonobacter oris]|uniref:Oxidoreductase n=1 Tax=Chelonobacter oris TaxID=505317 RepID=A0A0A3AJM9_9PAST|nr:sulfurtransferase TusA family protein [Chelonobacter oris]KGQ69593.1 oxidoreductase [Chelonobacter oris]
MQYQLNTLGQVCPFSLLEVQKAVKPLVKGDSLIVEFDCTQATRTIAQWAAEEGYQVTDFARLDDAKWTITLWK